MKASGLSGTVAGRALGPGSRSRSGQVTLLALTALLLASCGSVAPTRPAADSRSLNHPSVPVSTALRAQERAMHEQVLASLHDESDSRVRYGTIPSFIPQATLPVNRIVTATPAHPALAIEGSSVELRAPTGTTLMTAVGPNVPDRDQGSFQNDAPVSFELTFADVHGTIPIRTSLFRVTDEIGSRLHIRLSTLAGGSVPPTVPAGKPFTLTLKTRIPIGSGAVQYLPAGSRYLAEWDFDAETD